MGRRKPDERPLFVMALPVCRGRSIGDNALRRAAAISQHYRSVVISDSFPDQVPSSVETVRIEPPRFDFLRRLCHVPNELGFAWAVRRALETLHRDREIGFVLCHSYSLARFAGLWFRRRTGIPFGMFMHGHIFERPKGMYDALTTTFYRRIAPTCYRESHLLLALSPAQAELALAAGASPEQMVLAPNGLDVDDLGLDPDTALRKVQGFELRRPLRCLYVGRLALEKGVDVMLRAFAELRSREVPFSLDLIGQGPERDRLLKLAEELGLAECCHFLGRFPRRELGLRLLDHDLLVVPSLTEALGNVVLEGMATGCLVVASDTGGIPSMIRHRENGLLVRSGDPAALCQALREVAEGRVEARQIVRSALAWVQENASWTAIGRRIEAAAHALATDFEPDRQVGPMPGTR